MKRSVLKLVAISLLLLILVTSLSACSKIKGKYVREDGDYYEAYEFFYFGGKMIYTFMVEDFSISGSYEISKDGKTIYITKIGETEEYTYSKSGKAIYIDGIKYVKE